MTQPNKKNVKQQKWSSDDQALSLLKDINSIIGDEADAEQQRIQKELERRRAEEQQAGLKAEEERKRQGEALLAKERQLFEEKERKREEERKALERKQKIEKGEIDPAKEEAARVAAEEEKRRQDLLALSKDQALTEAQSLIRQQQQELRKLSEFSLAPVVPPPVVEVPIEVKRSPLPMILIVLVLVGGGVAAALLLQPKPENAAPQQAAEGVLLQTGNGALLVKLDSTAAAAVDVGVYQGSGPDQNKIFEHKADPWKVDTEALSVTTTASGDVVVADDSKTGKDRRRERKGDRKDSRKAPSKPAAGTGLKTGSVKIDGGFKF